MSPEKSTRAGSQKTGGFSAEERAAIKEYAREKKAEALGKQNREQGEKDVLAAIAALQEPDRSTAGRLHEIIHATAPDLAPKTWYGMPAYARDGKVICFFQSAQKFKARYATLGFSDGARLDDGELWPVVYAVKEMTPAVEARLIALVKKAVS